MKMYKNILSLGKKTISLLSKKAGWVKIAGINFSIAGSEKIAQPKILNDLCFDMIHYFYTLGEQLNYGQISPDGRDFDKYVGTINFYYGGHFDREYLTDENGINLKDENGNYQWTEKQNKVVPGKIRRLIKEYAEYDSSVIMEVVKWEKSNSRDANVARIKVYKNKTQDYKELPTMHLSNGNATTLLQLLNYAEDGTVDFDGEAWGAINVDKLKIAISNIDINPRILQEFTRKPEEYRRGKPTQPTQPNNKEINMFPTGDDDKFIDDSEPISYFNNDNSQSSGGYIYSHGLDESRLLEYLNVLQDMINYIDENELPERVIHFG